MAAGKEPTAAVRDVHPIRRIQVSDIPKLDLEASDLAQMIDAVLGDRANNAANERTAATVFQPWLNSNPSDSTNTAVHGDEKLNQEHVGASTIGGGAQALREHLANVTVQREQLLKALEAANRKAAIGGLNAELKNLTNDIENQLVRYAALMHPTKATPLGLLNLAPLYSRESKQRAQQMVDEIKQRWREG